MEQAQLNELVSKLSALVDSESLAQIKSILETKGDSAVSAIMSTEMKSKTTSLILALFDLDRIYLKQIGLGIFKFITGGGCFIWWLIDLFSVGKRTAKANGKTILNVLNSL